MCLARHTCDREKHRRQRGSQRPRGSVGRATSTYARYRCSRRAHVTYTHPAVSASSLFSNTARKIARRQERSPVYIPASPARDETAVETPRMTDPSHRKNDVNTRDCCCIYAHLLYPFGSRIRLPLLQVRDDLGEYLLAGRDVVVGLPRETVTGCLRGQRQDTQKTGAAEGSAKTGVCAQREQRKEGARGGAAGIRRTKATRSLEDSG